jgi:hypothetical protein
LVEAGVARKEQVARPSPSKIFVNAKRAGGPTGT